MIEPVVLLAEDPTRGTCCHYAGRAHGWAGGQIHVMDAELAGPALGIDWCVEVAAAEVPCHRDIGLKIGLQGTITFLGKFFFSSNMNTYIILYKRRKPRMRLD